VNVQIQIPDDVAEVFCPEGASSGPDVPRAVLEALALEGYRSRRLSESQVRRLLGLDTRIQVHAFLKRHGVPLNYTVEDLEKDLLSLEAIERKLEPRAG
jgi:hypothetical protein